MKENYFCGKINSSQEPHIYGKYGYSIIKTKRSIEKHFFDIDDWEFYYDDGNIAGKSSILSNIHAMNLYAYRKDKCYLSAIAQYLLPAFLHFFFECPHHYC